MPPTPTARSMALQHQCVTHSYSFTNRIHSTAIASLYPRDGKAEERSIAAFYMTAMTASTRKRGARYGSVIWCPAPESTWGGGACARKRIRPLCRTRAPKCALLLDFFTQSLIDVANTTPTLTHPTLEQAFLVNFFSVAVPSFLAASTSGGINILRKTPYILMLKAAGEHAGDPGRAGTRRGDR
jgi:hypothetical protein